MTADDPRAVRVAPLMREIEGDVWSRLRRRLVDRGVGAYSDEELFARVRGLLQRAADERDLDLLVLPELLGAAGEWKPDPNVTWSTHRPGAFGGLVLFVKRRLILPLTRWLFEYSQTNFRRQQHLNLVLIACLEELAIENARLRRDVDALGKK